jgi:biotin transporter BioY
MFGEILGRLLGWVVEAVVTGYVVDRSRSSLGCTIALFWAAGLLALAVGVIAQAVSERTAMDPIWFVLAFLFGAVGPLLAVWAQGRQAKRRSRTDRRGRRR